MPHESLADDCLAGGGEMGALMRSIDWAKTPIGPATSWSPALRTMVRMLLVNRFQPEWTEQRSLDRGEEE